jgi:hypothetical protein
MIEAFFSNPYPVIGDALLACFIGYVAHRNNKFIRLAVAAAAFRASFSGTLASLRNGSDDPYPMLEQQFLTHESSVLEFALHLNYIQRERFMKSWHDYYCLDGDSANPLLAQYSKHLGSTELATKNRNLAIQRIEQLLTYAKQT